MTADDDDLLSQAMADVVPLADRDRVVKKPVQSPLPPPPASAKITVSGDEGRAYGVSEKQLAKLRSGAHRVGHTVDLHRAHADAAKQMVARHIRDAVTAGVRCVLIVHGRGAHSAGAPVLRGVVVKALTSGTCAKHVLAFCPALAADGGPGAMYVLLRKQT